MAESTPWEARLLAADGNQLWKRQRVDAIEDTLLPLAGDCLAESDMRQYMLNGSVVMPMFSYPREESALDSLQ